MLLFKTKLCNSQGLDYTFPRSSGNTLTYVYVALHSTTYFRSFHKLCCSPVATTAIVSCFLAKDRVIFLQKPWGGRGWSKRGGWSSQGGMLLAASWVWLGSVTFSMSIALSFLNPLVININAVIVHFLISLVLLVNCSYLNPFVIFEALPLVPPVTHRRWGKRWEEEVGTMVWSLRGGREMGSTKSRVTVLCRHSMKSLEYMFLQAYSYWKVFANKKMMFRKNTGSNLKKSKNFFILFGLSQSQCFSKLQSP